MANIRLFEHSNIAGRQLFLASPSSTRYLLATSSFLDEFDFNDITSSVRLSTVSKDPSQSCLLFENDRFDGKFKAFAFNKTRDIISLPYYNDLTSSVILVSHDPEPQKTVFALRKVAGDRINQSVDRQLITFPGLKREKDVLLKFTIDAYEIGQYGNDLVKVEIPLTLQTPFPFKKYRIHLNYYIDLFINPQHVLEAAVVGWHYWVEAGILSKSIEKLVISDAADSPLILESLLNIVLHEFSWHRWKDVYLLPGATDAIDKDYEGNVDDDCTVVLVPLD